MALGPHNDICFFPPGYNETWLWCLIAGTLRNTRIRKIGIAVDHHERENNEWPDRNYLIGEQLGVLLYRVLWRLRSELINGDTVGQVLLSKRATDLIEHLSPSARVAALSVQGSREEGPNKGSHFGILRQLSGDEWQALVLGWVARMEEAERDWNVEFVSIRTLMTEVLL